jgi:hypothetical protein
MSQLKEGERCVHITNTEFGQPLRDPSQPRVWENGEFNALSRHGSRKRLQPRDGRMRARGGGGQTGLPYYKITPVLCVRYSPLPTNPLITCFMPRGVAGHQRQRKPEVLQPYEDKRSTSGDSSQDSK